jgi:hypothetical protein
MRDCRPPDISVFTQLRTADKSDQIQKGLSAIVLAFAMELLLPFNDRDLLNGAPREPNASLGCLLDLVYIQKL